MTGFSSTDDFLSEITAGGKFWRADYMKNLHDIGTVVAGRWYDLTGFAGNPVQFIHGNHVRNADFMATSDPWLIGTANWAYTPATHLMTRTANADVSTLSQSTRCIPGEKYTVVYTMTRSAGTLTPNLGGTALTARSAAGTYREDVICGTGAGAPITFTPDSSYAGTVDLVWIGRSLEFFPYSADSENAPYLGPIPANPDTKHMVNISAYNTALLGSPSVLMVVDMLGVYPSIKTKTLVTQHLKHRTRLRNGYFVGAETGWTLGTSWAYGTNSVVRTEAANVATLSQTGLDILANVPYQLKFTMSSSSGAGTITPSLGGTAGTPRTADGTYVETIVAGATYGDLVFTPTNNNIATTITAVELIPLIPRYADGAGVRAFMATTPGETLPGTGAQAVAMTYRGAAALPTELSVDTCDATTGWTDSADMTVSLNTTTFREGIGALNLTKDGTGAALASTSKDTTSQTFTGRKLGFWLYIIDAAAYAKLAASNALRVRFGSDSSNYYSFDFANTALLGPSQTGVGWQWIECNILNPTGTTGTPNLAAMDYCYIGLTASASGTVWAAGDFIIDNIIVVDNGSQLGATVANTASSIARHILHSGAASGNFGPFLPIANGLTGIRRCDNVTFSAASNAEGSVSLVLCKPLVSIPLPYGFVAAERDLMNMLPSLPRIYDGACLGFILYLGAVSVAGTMWVGHMDFAWG